MPVSLNFSYILYKVNKMIVLIYLPKYYCKLTKSIGFYLYAYCNVYTFIYTNYFLNMWFLICYLILTIPEKHVFKSK